MGQITELAKEEKNLWHLKDVPEIKIFRLWKESKNTAQELEFTILEDNRFTKLTDSVKFELYSVEFKHILKVS